MVVDGADRLRPGQPVTAGAARQRQDQAGQSSGQSAAQPANSGVRQSDAGKTGQRQPEAAVSLSPSRPFILRPVATSLLMAAILLAGGIGLSAVARLRAA